VHGEAKAKLFFKEKLLEQGFSKVIIPEKGNVFELD
jgi:hypothetical protein